MHSTSQHTHTHTHIEYSHICQPIKCHFKRLPLLFTYLFVCILCRIRICRFALNSLIPYVVHSNKRTNERTNPMGIFLCLFCCLTFAFPDCFTLEQTRLFEFRAAAQGTTNEHTERIRFDETVCVCVEGGGGAWGVLSGKTF